MNHANVYHRFIKLTARAGVPRLPFHGLRHTHATLLMKAGVHPKVVAERMGHVDINLTLSCPPTAMSCLQMRQEAVMKEQDA